MKVELIPLLLLGYQNQGVPVPVSGRYWTHAEIWEAYHQQCYQRAGFKDAMPFYTSGFPFISLHTLSDDNLLKIVSDHIQKLLIGEMNREDLIPLSGGYLLKIDGEDQYFPQCCEDLASIRYWEKLSVGQLSYMEGHPVPQVEIADKQVLLDFRTKEFEEDFEPPPATEKLILELESLLSAVKVAKHELNELGERLQRMDREQGWNIGNLDYCLIWSNPNYS